MAKGRLAGEGGGSLAGLIGRLGLIAADELRYRRRPLRAPLALSLFPRI